MPRPGATKNPVESERDSSMGGISGQVAAGILLSAFSVCCVAQQDKSSTDQQVPSNSQTVPFLGCYELKLGRWWPWGFGEDSIFATPPNRIKLLPERGTVGFEQNGFLIREITPGKGEKPWRGSYWLVKSADQLELIWTTGFSGVTLELNKQGNDLHGRAHPFGDFPRLSRVARATARRIACDVAR